MFKLTRYLVLIVVLIAAAVVLGAFFYFSDSRDQSSSPGQPVSEGEETIVVPEAPTESDYKSETRAALADYLESRQNMPDSLSQERAELEAPAIAGLKDSVLAVVVPAEFRDFHLELVLALTQIEQGILKEDTGLWKKGEAGLDKIVSQNPWLSE